MQRRQRIQILEDTDIEYLEEVVNRIEKQYKVEIVEPPSSRLVMMKTKKDLKSPLFKLGEEFVTECRVAVKGIMGFGTVKSIDIKKAYYMAIIDAVYNGKLNMIEELDEMLQQAKLMIEQGRILKI